MNKTVYDKRDGSIRILDKSDLCPISGKWLIPANCTEEEPPKVEEGYKVSFQNGKWITEKTEEQIEKEETRKYEPVVKSLREQIEESMNRRSSEEDGPCSLSWRRSFSA